MTISEVLLRQTHPKPEKLRKSETAKLNQM